MNKTIKNKIDALYSFLLKENYINFSILNKKASYQDVLSSLNKNLLKIYRGYIYAKYPNFELPPKDLGSLDEKQVEFLENLKKVILNVHVPKDIEEKNKALAISWIITYLKKNPLQVEVFLNSKNDYGYLRNNLEYFFHWQRFMEKPDLFSISSPEELRGVVNQAKSKIEEYQEKQKYMDAEAGTNLIYENEDWKVFIPENLGASCQLGKGTSWCTTIVGGREDHYQKYHSPEDPLIIFISKKNPKEKYQFHFGSKQFHDIHNEKISDEKILEFYQLLLKVKLPKNILESIKYILKYYGITDLGNGQAFEVKIDGEKQWYQNGELHREDGPAVIFPDGSKYWYQNGKLHREDGPAEIHSDGYQAWYFQGKLHREDGPAAIDSDGYKAWYQNGKPHREDGPAVINSDGTKIWWLNGERHRKDGPAAIYPNGTKVWYFQGKRHREDGPAEILYDGEKRWYRNGKPHREDGPAEIHPDGIKQWYLNGISYSFENWSKKVRQKKKEARFNNILKIATNLNHTIKSGDRLENLVIRYYFDNNRNIAIKSGILPDLVTAVAQYNKMPNPGALRIDQVLQFPPRDSLVPTPNRSTRGSSSLVTMIKAIEKFHPTPYEDPKGSGVNSIGYGHRMPQGDTHKYVTESQAHSLLMQDLTEAASYVRYNITRKLDQKQFDAITSIVYNVGRSRFNNSKLRASLNNPRVSNQAIGEMIKNSFLTKEYSGLEKRRAIEANLYLGGAYG